MVITTSCSPSTLEPEECARSILQAFSRQGFQSALTEKPKTDFRNIAFVLLGKAKTGHIQQLLELER